MFNKISYPLLPVIFKILLNGGVVTMALDGAFLHIIKDEITPLIGGRIDKIHQPSREEILLSLRTRSGGAKILISASAASARVHITKKTYDNPKTPPMFCMLMRKHLNTGRLIAVRQDGLERILFLDFETVNEIGDVVTITLVCEIMGKYSNLIMVNQSGKVIDSLKRVDSEMSQIRLVLPGIRYELPPREERLNFLTCSREDILFALSAKKEESGDRMLSKAVISIFEGISPVLAREWIYRSDKNGEPALSALSEEQAGRLADIIIQTREDVERKNQHFTVIRDGDGCLKDFSFVDITQYEDLMTSEEFDSAGELLDHFYSERDRTASIKQKAGDMYRLLQSTEERIARRLAVQKEELKKSADRDVLKLKGDLISANIYRLEKGMGSFEAENYYDEKGGTVHIELDRRLTPSQNMQKFYAEYRKADTAEKILTEQIEKGEEELKYIESVSDSLSRSKTGDEIAELREELAEQGYLKHSGKKNKSIKPQPPIMFKSPDGYDIAVGRNNIQNDRLTLKTAEKTDIWLHTKDIPGSHVIIFTHGTVPPDETILYAARIAAAHSKARNSSQVPVDYVPVRLVKKPAGANPGKVIFTGNRTVYVQPLDI